MSGCHSGGRGHGSARGRGSDRGCLLRGTAHRHESEHDFTQVTLDCFMSEVLYSTVGTPNKEQSIFDVIGSNKGFFCLSLICNC